MLNTTGTGTRWNKKNDFRIVRRDEKRVLGFGSFLRAEKLMNLYITDLGRTCGGRGGGASVPGLGGSRVCREDVTSCSTVVRSLCFDWTFIDWITLERTPEEGTQIFENFQSRRQGTSHPEA